MAKCDRKRKTYSEHSLSAVSILLMTDEFKSKMAAAVWEVSRISDMAATALATTCKTETEH